MLKKMLALTLALVMAIMPMTASAVTWGEVVTGLKTEGSYTNAEENVYAEIWEEDGWVDVYGTGTITGTDNVIVIKQGEVDGVWDYYFYGVTLDAEQIQVKASENEEWFYVDFCEDTVVKGDVVAEVSGENSFVGTWLYEGATIQGDMNVIASGKNSGAQNYISGGTVGGSVNAEANAEGAVAMNSVNDGYKFDEETGEVIPVEADVKNVTSSASNGGTVENALNTELDSMTAVIGEGGKVVAGFMGEFKDEETGEWVPEFVSVPVNAKNVTVVIEAGAEDTYTAEQIKAMIAATGMEPTETVYYTVNADGERTAEYSIGADGKLTFVRKLIEEYTAEELEYIKKMDKIARENHEREIKRHAEKLGGITASPEWVKQLFIGYMSLNLRMYEEGEQILFRERLAWADTDDGTLNLTLRVNIAEPKALTIRLDENVLDKLEQANISVVTLLAKDGTPVMQYKVSDLRGAYTQYGLTGTDLLVVGGADDDVMKIGADGVMKPVEAE